MKRLLTILEGAALGVGLWLGLCTLATMAYVSYYGFSDDKVLVAVVILAIGLVIMLTLIALAILVRTNYGTSPTQPATEVLPDWLVKHYAEYEAECQAATQAAIRREQQYRDSKPWYRQNTDLLP